LNDLLVELEATSGRKLDAWIKTWLQTAGVNTLRPQLEIDGDVYKSVVISQEAPLVPAGSQELRPHRLAVGLYDIAGESLQGKSTDEWLDIFEGLDIPCGRISTLDDVFNDPHLKAINLFEKFNHPTEGEFFMTNFPLRFSETKIDKPRMPPKFGEHGPEIFAEIGFSDDEIADLFQIGRP
ncbi:MAG: CoA transferase, partial [Bacteroidota bacterium]